MYHPYLSQQLGGVVPLTPLDLEKMHHDVGYTGASVRKLFQAGLSKASNSKRLLTQLPTLVRTTTQIATFKAGAKRTTTHQHLFLPKDYSGSPTEQPHLSGLWVGIGGVNQQDLTPVKNSTNKDHRLKKCLFLFSSLPLSSMISSS